MSKAAAAFRTISEVADELDVPKHVLRFWELKFPQLKPMKRGGGRRYYRPEDLDLLRGIRHLLHSDGYTIKGVQKILREQGIDAAKSAAKQGQPRAHGQPTKSSARVSAREKQGSTLTVKGESAKSTAEKKSSRIKATASPTLSPQIPAKNVKTVEHAIKELQACREILSPKDLQIETRTTAAKSRRVRSAQ